MAIKPTKTPVSLADRGLPSQHRVNVPKTVSTTELKDPYADLSATVNTRKTRGQFRAIEFTRAIRQHGYFLTWRKAVLCPCRNPKTDQVKMNCKNCDGSGIFYFDPIKVRGIMTALERNVKPYEKFGSWNEGTSMLTVEPQYRMHFMDQIQMTDSVMTHAEWIKKGNRHGTRTRLPKNVDSGRYRIIRMIQALVVDENTDIVYALDEGKHFKIDGDGWVEWLTNDVADGMVVSLLYEYHPIWIVMSHVHALRDVVIETKNPQPEVTSLPVQTRVKLDFLAEINIPPPSLMSDLSPDGRDPERPPILGRPVC
jgi:hypothetical protein